MGRTLSVVLLLVGVVVSSVRADWVEGGSYVASGVTFSPAPWSDSSTPSWQGSDGSLVTWYKVSGYGWEYDSPAGLETDAADFAGIASVVGYVESTSSGGDSGSGSGSGSGSSGTVIMLTSATERLRAVAVPLLALFGSAFLIYLGFMGFRKARQAVRVVERGSSSSRGHDGASGQRHHGRGGYFCGRFYYGPRR